MPIPTIESTYAPLPWVIVHGALVWKLLIGLAALAAPTIVRLRRRRAAATRMARVVRRATSELRPGPVALRARLRGAALRSARQQVWGYPAPHITPSDATSAALQVGDDTVTFAGRVEVAAGSSSTVDRWPGRTRDGALIAWRQELTISADAAVVCAGVLERDDAGTWTLRSPPAQPVEVYALANRGAAAPTARLRLLVATALGSGAMACFLFLLGLAMERRMEAADRRFATASVADIPVRVQIAAMTPSGRDSAMRWLDAAAQTPIGRAEIGRALAVGRLRGADPRTRVLLALDRHDELLALARQRGDDELAFAALARLARFDEAADLMPRIPGLDHGTALSVAIAAGRWMDAATRVDAIAAELPAGSRQDAAACVAAWMRHVGGAASAADRLRDAAGHNDACALIVDATDAVPRPAAPKRPGRYVPRNKVDGWYAVDRTLTGEHVDCRVDRGAVWIVPYIALHGGAVEATAPADDYRHYELGVGTASSQADRCRAAWALLADLPGADPVSLRADAIYTAEPILDAELSRLDPAVGLRRGVLDRYALDLTDHRARAVVLDALEGDARSFAGYLRGHELYRAYEIALGLAPNLRRGQAELAEALLWSRHLTASHGGDQTLIGETLHRAFKRRTIMRLLGRADLAEPDAAIVARVVAVLADRDKVLALAFVRAL